MKKRKIPVPISDMVSKDIAIKGDGWELGARVSVSTKVTEPAEMLPLARALSDAVVAETFKVVARSGETVSCRAGCGACCRHMVAISEVEARRISEMIDTMPEPRRTAIRTRFAEARERLEQSNLLDRLQNPDTVTDEEYGPLALEYFSQRIPCPFLENESCSIYDERPITCREYLVMSPSENCARPEENNVRRVQMPLRVFNAVARWTNSPGTNFKERWVPLILAPEWAATTPPERANKSGVQLLKDLLHHLATKEEDSDSLEN